MAGAIVLAIGPRRRCTVKRGLAAERPDLVSRAFLWTRWIFERRTAPELGGVSDSIERRSSRKRGFDSVDACTRTLTTSRRTASWRKDILTLLLRIRHAADRGTANATEWRRLKLKRSCDKPRRFDGLQRVLLQNSVCCNVWARTPLALRNPSEDANQLKPAQSIVYPTLAPSCHGKPEYGGR